MRNPWSAYADTKKRPVPLSLAHYLLGWTLNQYYALLFRRLEKNPLLRISVHPPDLRHEKVWRQIRDSISRALASRAAMPYAKWIDARRANEGI